MDRKSKIKQINTLSNTNFYEFLKKYVDINSDNFKINILKLLSTDIIDNMYSELTDAGTPARTLVHNSPLVINTPTPTPTPKQTNIQTNIQLTSPSPSQSFKPTKSRKGTIRYYHEKMIQCARFNIGDEFNVGTRNEHRIKILQELSVREDTILYIGEVLKTDSIKDKRVIIKIQPRYNKELLESIIGEKISIKTNLHLPYQVTTESYIMNKLRTHCPNAIVSQMYFYGSIKIPDQIERYILISTELYRDLTILKGQHIDIIKKSILLAINALKKFHECGLLHMDIKHENMMFSTSDMNEVKLIDFGSTEEILNRHGNRKLDEPVKGIEGTPMYMSIGQHEKNIKDYMDDIQAFAWMLLDLLSDRLIMQGMYWFGFNYQEICDKKKEFIYNAINGFPNKQYNDLFIGGNLTEHNLKVIGELAVYSYKRADMANKYSSDKYQSKYNYYYSDFNDNYYKDIAKIINKLI
jgi:hypothetical protein